MGNLESVEKKEEEQHEQQKERSIEELPEYRRKLRDAWITLAKAKYYNDIKEEKSRKQSYILDKNVIRKKLKRLRDKIDIYDTQISNLKKKIKILINNEERKGTYENLIKEIETLTKKREEVDNHTFDFVDPDENCSGDEAYVIQF